MQLKDLINKCCQKDEKAQKLLFELFSPKVMTVCRRYSSTNEDAREYFQECFYQILMSIKNFDPDQGEFEGWMYKLCYYTILKLRKNEVKFFDLNHEQIETDEDNQNEFPVSEEALISEIQKLPEGYRLVLNLYAFEGLSHKEISLCLNITESTSRSQFARAKSLLKKRLSNHNRLQYVSRSI